MYSIYFIYSLVYRYKKDIKSSCHFIVHEAGGAGDIHPVSGQLEVCEEGDKNNVPSEAGLRTISRGRLHILSARARADVRACVRVCVHVCVCVCISLFITRWLLLNTKLFIPRHFLKQSYLTFRNFIDIINLLLDLPTSLSPAYRLDSHKTGCIFDTLDNLHLGKYVSAVLNTKIRLNVLSMCIYIVNLVIEHIKIEHIKTILLDYLF